MQAADAAVDRIESAGDARHPAARALRALGVFERDLGRFVERFDGIGRAAVRRDLEQRLFGLVDLFARVDVLAGIQRLFDHLAPDRHQFAQQGEVVNLSRELARADQPRARSGQLGEIGGAAQLRHPLVLFEHRFQRHWRREHVVLAQRPDRAKDAAMDRFEEMLVLDYLDNVVGQPVVDHHRAQQRGLRLDILGQAGGGVRRRGGRGRIHRCDRGHGPLSHCRRRHSRCPGLFIMWTKGVPAR